MRLEFRADLDRYRTLGGTTIEIVSNPAVWAILWYRVGYWIYHEEPPRIFRLPLKIIHSLGMVFFDAFMQMRLNPSAKIGPGLLIAHTGGISLHPRLVMGSHCDLAHYVTIGTPGVGQSGVPRIGNSVYVGTGAVIIGDIEIGDGARIGANSLVNRDVPAFTTVMGVPAVVVKTGAGATKPVHGEPVTSRRIGL